MFKTMKNKSYVKLVILLLMTITFTGCLNDLFDENDLTFQQDPQLEFRPTSVNEDEDEGASEYLIQLIGPQRDSDLSVSFSVDASQTDAVAGTHYSIPSTSATIAANTSSATVTVNFNGTGLDAGQQRVLALVIDEGGEVRPAPNLKTLIITIDGVDGN